MLFAPLTNENLCGQGLDTSDSVLIVTIKTVSDFDKEDQTKPLCVQKRLAMKTQIKTSFKSFCSDKAYFEHADSRNLHILPHRSQFLSSCHCEQNSELFYVRVESGCFAKNLSYQITVTNDRRRIRKERRMP